MAFRDDDLATQSRVDVLQGELDELRAENEALKRTKTTPKRDTDSGWSGPLLLVAALVIGFFALLYILGGEFGLLLLMLAIPVLACALVAIVIRRLLFVVVPGRIAVFSGRNHIAPDGQTRGFRIVTEGTTIRIPFLERHDELRTGPFSVDSVLRNVYEKGGGKLDVQVRAKIAIARTEPLIVDAVERFLGRDEEEVAAVGRETVEGAARGVVALLTVHELREDRARVEQTLMSELESDLGRLGLTLESFHILEVTEV